MNKKNAGSSPWLSKKWWKDTIVILGLAAMIYFAMWYFNNVYLVQGQSGNIISVCYLSLVGLALLFLIHLFYPGRFRWVLAMALTAIANHNREAIPPKEIADQLGIDGQLDKDLARVTNAEMNIKTCSDNNGVKTELTVKFLKKIDPKVSSIEELFNRIQDKGPRQYYPIIRKLISKEHNKLSMLYRAVYEFVAEVDKSTFDKEEHKYRKENLKCLICAKDLNDIWLFHSAFIEVFYQDEDYDEIIEQSQTILSSIETSNPKSIECRTYVYFILGSIYMERKQYNYAIPYLEEVGRTSSMPVPALFRLAHLYSDVFQNYKLGLEYSQLCFAKLSDLQDPELWNHMEWRLIQWIVYCSAACGEYEKGYITLENYLKSTKSKLTIEKRADFEACLAYLSTKTNKWDNADNLSKKALSCNPMNVTAVNVKGMCEMRNGHFELAINCFAKIIPEFKKEKALQAKYYLGEIYNNLAICEAKLGRNQEADEHFRAAFDCGYPMIDLSEFAKIATSPLGMLNNENTRKPLQKNRQ